MKPFAFDAYSQVTYQVKKISTIPKEVVCAPHVDASTRQQELLQRQKKEQLVLRPFDELFTKKDFQVEMEPTAVEHEVCLHLSYIHSCLFCCRSATLSLLHRSDYLCTSGANSDGDLSQASRKGEGAEEASACIRTWSKP